MGTALGNFRNSRFVAPRNSCALAPTARTTSNSRGRCDRPSSDLSTRHLNVVFPRRRSLQYTHAVPRLLCIRRRYGTLLVRSPGYRLDLRRATPSCRRGACKSSTVVVSLAFVRTPLPSPRAQYNVFRPCATTHTQPKPRGSGVTPVRRMPRSQGSPYGSGRRAATQDRQTDCRHRSEMRLFGPERFYAEVLRNRWPFAFGIPSVTSGAPG